GASSIASAWAGRGGGRCGQDAGGYQDCARQCAERDPRAGSYSGGAVTTKLVWRVEKRGYLGIWHNYEEHADESPAVYQCRELVASCGWHVRVVKVEHTVVHESGPQVSGHDDLTLHHAAVVKNIWF